MRQIFIDTETTGFSPAQGDRLVEVAAVLCENGKVVDHFHQYLNPQRSVPLGAQNVHGLDENFLADKPLFVEIVDDFVEFVRGSEVIIHNAPFDEMFLDAELERISRPPLAEIVAKITCSLKWARTNKPELERHTLSALCRYYDISLHERDLHGALVDAMLLGKVYYRMNGG